MNEIIELFKTAATIKLDNGSTKAYINSANGRALLANEQPAQIVTEIIKVWGDSPIELDILPSLVPPTFLPSSIDILGEQVAQLSISNMQKDQIINALGAQIAQNSLEIITLKSNTRGV